MLHCTIQGFISPGGGVGTGMKLNLLLHCTVQYRASFDEEQGRGSGMKWNHVALQKTGLLFPGGTGGGDRHAGPS